MTGISSPRALWRHSRASGATRGAATGIHSLQRGVRVVGMPEGTVPWHKPWHVKTGLPRNLITQKPYRGINVFLLMAMNYESPHWLTLRQANLLGGQIKPGAE